MDHDGIIDKFFITFDSQGHVEWKGWIEAHVGLEYFMVGVFNRAPNKVKSYKIVELKDMKDWMLFSMDDEMYQAFDWYWLKKLKDRKEKK